MSNFSFESSPIKKQKEKFEIDSLKIYIVVFIALAGPHILDFTKKINTQKASEEIRNLSIEAIPKYDRDKELTKIYKSEEFRNYILKEFKNKKNK